MDTEITLDEIEKALNIHKYSENAEEHEEIENILSRIDESVNESVIEERRRIVAPKFSLDNVRAR